MGGTVLGGSRSVSRLAAIHRLCVLRSRSPRSRLHRERSWALGWTRRCLEAARARRQPTRRRVPARPSARGDGVSTRPPLSELLADPAGMVLRTDLLRAGWPSVRSTPSSNGVDAVCWGSRGRSCWRRMSNTKTVLVRQFIRVQNGFERRGPKPFFAPPSTSAATLPRGVAGACPHRPRRGAATPVPRQIQSWAGASTKEHAGSFRRKSEAVLRRNFVSGLLAAGLGAEIRAHCARSL